MERPFEEFVFSDGTVARYGKCNCSSKKFPDLNLYWIQWQKGRNAVAWIVDDWILKTERIEMLGPSKSPIFKNIWGKVCIAAMNGNCFDSEGWFNNMPSSQNEIDQQDANRKTPPNAMRVIGEVRQLKAKIVESENKSYWAKFISFLIGR